MNWEAGRKTALIVTAVILAACAPAAMVNQQSEEAAIRAIGQDWQRAIVARDVDRIISFHAPDVVIMNSNTPLVTGTAAARTAWMGMTSMPGASLTWTPAQIEVTSPTTATETGSYNMSFNGPAGRVNDTGNYVTLWRKLDGQWRVARDVTVSTTPMPMGDATATAMPMDGSGMETRASEALAWQNFQPKGFPAGAKMVVVHGDPSKAGDYALRVNFPDGYQFPVHWHTNGEHVTVLSGTFLVAMGGSGDRSAVQAYAPGAFIYMPARSPHYGGARGETVIQLHGNGPFVLNLGTP